MGEPQIMDPRQVEDRALKKMLRSSDFGREVEIPRAAVKRFPSNVSSSNFRRSASARAPSRQKSFPGTNTPPNPYFPKSNAIYPFKTPPIDIATLHETPKTPNRPTRPIDIATLHDPPLPSPKIPISRGLGRSYSNRDDSPRPQPVPQAARRTPPPPGGGGSFLYSGNYDPNSPNGRIITKPVPLARSQSLNFKHAGPVPKRSPNRNPREVGGLKNPLAIAGGAAIMEDEVEDEVDSAKFDDWAEDLYNDNNNNEPRAGAKVAVVAKPGKKKGGKKPVKNEASPQQNWVLAGGPAAAGGKENKATLRDEMLDAAGEAALEQGQEALTNLLAGGELNPADLVGGIGGALGAKAGGKLGGKLGKKLGNEEMGEAIGEELGGIAGEMAADAAKDAAMDAMGDLAAGGIDGLEPPEMPDASKLCSKCSVM